MCYRQSTFLLLAAGALSAVPTVRSLTEYANDFIDPAPILAKTYNNTTLAQKTILSWADQLAQSGPWGKALVRLVGYHSPVVNIAVTNKPFPPPSGDVHDYMSWAP
jgi:hypothetical protein